MTQQFTLGWPYGWQICDGRKVEIYRTDAPATDHERGGNA